jgi:hypothetical protein
MVNVALILGSLEKVDKANPLQTLSSFRQTDFISLPTTSIKNPAWAGLLCRH